MKILLADDDEISRKIIASFLARFGYEAHVVQNGAEAWDVLQRPGAPTLAICDWMMPRMTGPEVCARLRAIKQPARTYVILLSSRNSKFDIVKGLDAGADDYLVKPCDLTELQARLRVALRMLNRGAAQNHCRIRGAHPPPHDTGGNGWAACRTSCLRRSAITHADSSVPQHSTGCPRLAQ